MMYGSSEMDYNRLLFTLLPPWQPEKSKFWKKMKKLSGDIIILHSCNINDNHMMYGSRDTECNGHNFLSFWTMFCPFTQKIKIEKNEKNTNRYNFTHVYHKWQSYDLRFLRYGTWQTRIFVTLDHFLHFHTPTNPKNQNFEKMKNPPRDVTT